MFKFLIAGVRICQKNLSVILISIIFILVDKLISGITISNRFDTPTMALNLVIYLISSPAVMSLLLLSIAIKSFVIIGSSSDLLALNHNFSERLKIAWRIIFSINAVNFCLFNFLWYLTFFFLGSITVILTDTFINVVVLQWIICSFVGLILFPIFYAGFSIFGFFFTMRWKGYSWQMLWFIRKIKDNGVDLYKFYLTRSIVDVVGIGLALYLSKAIAIYSFTLSIIVEFAIISAIIGVLRAATMAYKLNIFNLDELLLSSPKTQEI